MLTLTRYDKALPMTAEHVGANDVVATAFGPNGEPQKLRSVLTRVDHEDGTFTFTFGMPKRGIADPDLRPLTCEASKNMLVVGCVKPRAAKPAAAKPAKPAAKPRGGEKPAPAKPAAKPAAAAPAAAPAPAAVSPLREQIRDLVRDKVQALVLQEISAVLDEALA